MAAEDAAPPTEGGGVAEAAKPEVVHGQKDIPDLGQVPVAPKAPVAEEPPEIRPEQRAEAAIAETKLSNHKVTYKAGEVEVQIQLPPKLLASFKYRIGALKDDDSRILQVIEKLLGPEQYETVMDAMDEAGLTDEEGEPNEEANTSFGNLLNDAMATYGMTPGESKASMNS